MDTTSLVLDAPTSAESGRGTVARAALIRAGVQIFGDNSLAFRFARETIVRRIVLAALTSPGRDAALNAQIPRFF